jgi:hypothetical protein
MVTEMDWFGPVVFGGGDCRIHCTDALRAVVAAEMIDYA